MRYNKNAVHVKHKAKLRIASVREKAGLSQLELSRQVGVTESTIQNWESGRSGIDQVERIIKFCKALNCQLEDLIEYVNQSTEELAARPSSLSEIHNLLGTDEPSSINKFDSQDAQQHQANTKTYRPD